MHIEMRRVQKSSLVEDAGLAPGRAQRAAVPGGRRRRQELAPAAPGEEAAAVGALLLRGGGGAAGRKTFQILKGDRRWSMAPGGSFAFLRPRFSSH